MFDNDLLTSEVLMDKDILVDIERVVEYLWRDEFKHWEEDDNPQEHVFHSVNNLKNYLEGIKRQILKEIDRNEAEI